MALHADPVRIDEPLRDERLDARHDGVECALPRITDLVRDIGDEHDVAAARVEGEADRGPVRQRCLVAVQPVGHALVEVDHERILLRGIEAVRLDQDAVERRAVVRHPVDEFGAPPPVFVLLRVGVAQLARVPEVGVSHPQVGELDERLACPHVTLGVLGLRRRSVPHIAHDQFLDPARLVRPSAREPGRLRSHVEDGEEDIALLDALARAATAEAAEAEEVAATALGHALYPVAEVGLLPLGETHGGLIAARVDAPHVVPVVHEHGGVPLDPCRSAVGGRSLRVVVEFVVEGDRKAPGQAARGGGAVHRRRLPVPVRLVPPVGIRSVGREAGAAEAAHRLDDHAALTGEDVDRVRVLVASVPRDLLTVRHIARGEGVVAQAALRARHVGDVRRAQLNDGVPPVVRHGQVRPVTLPVRLHELHRLQVRVAPVPDVERHAVRVEDLLVRLGLGTRRGAEEETVPVLAEGDRPVLADPPAGGHAGRLVVRHLLRRPAVGPVEREGRLVHLPLVHVAEEGEAFARLVEGDLLVVALPGEHFHALAARRIHEMDPVPALVLRRGHVGEPVPRVGHRVGNDVGPGVLRSGIEIQEDERRPIFLLVPLLVLRGALLFLLLGFFRSFLGLFGLFPGFLFLGLFFLLGSFGEEVGDESAPVLRDPEGIDRAGAPDSAVISGAVREGFGQVHDGERVPGEIVPALPFEAQGVDHGLHRRHAEGEVSRVPREGGRATPEPALRGPIAAGDHERGVAVPGRQDVGEPVAIRRDRAAADGVPAVRVLVLQARLDLLCGQRLGRDHETGREKDAGGQREQATAENAGGERTRDGRHPTLLFRGICGTQRIKNQRLK